MSNFMIKMFYKQRAEFNETSAARDKELSFPKGRENEILPVIIDVHGGGLLLGNKEFNRYFCAQISAMGYLVFSVEFRLVPEYQVYDQFADLSMAMDFIKDVIPKYHGDPEHVYVVGDSGGAYVITYTVAMQKNKALAEAAHVKPSSLKVKALGLISGMFYTNKLDNIGMFLPKYLYGKKYKKSAFAPYVNPEHPDIVKALPPCFLVTSEDDMLQHYTLNFEKALAKHHMPHELKRYPKNEKLTHAFSVFEPYMKESVDTMTSMLQFLCQY